MPFFLFLIFAFSCDKTEDQDKKNNDNDSAKKDLETLPVESSDVRSTFALLKGKFNLGGVSSAYQMGFCWSTQPNVSIQNSRIIEDKQLMSQGYIAPLKPNTKYYARYYLSLPNEQKLYYGEEVSFTTKPAIYQDAGTLSDIDGKQYKAIQLGNQTWMSEDLKATKYVNGDDMNYAGAANGYYDKITLNTNDVCPTGWHLPTTTDINELVDFLDVPAQSKYAFGVAYYWPFGSEMCSVRGVLSKEDLSQTDSTYTLYYNINESGFSLTGYSFAMANDSVFFAGPEVSHGVGQTGIYKTKYSYDYNVRCIKN